MIADLTQRAAWERAKSAVRAQGTKTVPARREGHRDVDVRWDVPAVLEHIDQAQGLHWDGDELVVRVHGDYVRRFHLPTAATLPATLRTASTTAHDFEAPLLITGRFISGRTSGGKTFAADAVRPVPAELAVAWEVDDAAGARVYIGEDLSLADELYRLLPGAHLIPLGVAS